MILYSPCGQSVEVPSGLVADFVGSKGYCYENPRPAAVVITIAPKVALDLDTDLIPETPLISDLQPLENFNLVNINKATLKALTDLSKTISIAEAKKVIESRPHETIESVIAVGGKDWYALRDKISF